MHKRLIAICLILLTICTGVCRADTALSITFFGDKAEDAILIESDAGVILIDTGYAATGKEISAYLDGREIDLLIITHYDKDHVKGSKNILKKTTVKRMICCPYFDDPDNYEDLMDRCASAFVTPESITETVSIDLGNIQLTIAPPPFDFEQENDDSLIVSMQYGRCSFLFAGDIENSRIAYLLSEGIDHYDFLKVPHHGRIENLSSVLFSAVSPTYAVITCSDEEPEDDLVTAFLHDAGAEIHYTRLEKIHILCDGQTITFQ